MEVDETAVARQSRGADPGAVERINGTHSKEGSAIILTSWASPEW